MDVRAVIYIAARQLALWVASGLLGLDFLIGLDGDVVVGRQAVDGVRGELGTVMSVSRMVPGRIVGTWESDDHGTV